MQKGRDEAKGREGASAGAGDNRERSWAVAAVAEADEGQTKSKCRGGVL